jgi:hypothetical protein
MGGAGGSGGERGLAGQFRCHTRTLPSHFASYHKTINFERPQR